MEIMLPDREQNRVVVYLHIGAPKTGSTSIQRAIARVASDEGNDIVRFPRAFWKGGSGNSLGLTLLATEQIDSFVGNLMGVKSLEERSAYQEKAIREARDEIAAASPATKAFCFSTENLFRSSEPEVYRCRQILDEVFGHDSYSVKIVAYLRRQDSFLLSLYTTRVADGYRFSLDCFLANCPRVRKMIHYHKTLSLWSNVFRNCTVVVEPFEEEHLFSEDVVRDFFDKIGMLPALEKVMEGKPPLRSNVGLGIYALEALRLLNSRVRRFKSSEETRAQRTLLRRLQREDRTGPPISECVSSDWRKEVLRAYHADNEALYSDFFVGGKRFSRKLSEAPGYDFSALQEINDKYLLKGMVSEQGKPA